MKKIQDKVLEEALEEIIATDSGKAAHEIVERLRKFQDASGLKVCQPKQTEEVF